MNEMELIDEINTIMINFTDKIKQEHHKDRDGWWSMEYNAWEELWYVSHKGYWLDSIQRSSSSLAFALQSFKVELINKITEEFGDYDFKNHCRKGD